MTFVERYRDSDLKHPYRNDVIASVLLVSLATVTAFNNGLSGDSLLATLVPEIITSLAFAFRRRFPIVVLFVVFGALVSALFNNAFINVSLLMIWTAVYTVGTAAPDEYPRTGFFAAHGRARNFSRAFVVAILLVAFSIGAFLGFFDDTSKDGKVSESFAGNLITALLVGVFLFSAWFIGDLVRIRRLNVAELARRNEELRAERSQNERRAVLNERVRIARELHDVVAHHVSLMGVQAGAARLAVRNRPERAEAALSEVERSSRQAVSELHKLLGFLRQDEMDSTAPQPMLRDLPGLVDDVQRAGREVRLTTSLDAPSEIGSSVQLTAFRIVQEALTNALKHSEQGPIDVTVAATSNEVRIRVDDHGVPAPKKPTERKSGGGHGLVGIRERIAFHGGTLHVRPSDRGFVVDATIPLTTQGATA